MVQCLVPFTGHCDLDRWPSFKKNHVQSISLILLKVGIPNLVGRCIPNLVCGCIVGWLSVLYHLRVTVTLTSDLVLIIIVSGAYLFYYLR